MIYTYILFKLCLKQIFKWNTFTYVEKEFWYTCNVFLIFKQIEKNISFIFFFKYSSFEDFLHLCAMLNYGVIKKERRFNTWNIAYFWKVIRLQTNEGMMNRLCVCLLIVRYARDERFQILTVIFRKQRIPCILKIGELEKKERKNPGYRPSEKHVFSLSFLIQYAVENSTPFKRKPIYKQIDEYQWTL